MAKRLESLSWLDAGFHYLAPSRSIAEALLFSISNDARFGFEYCCTRLCRLAGIWHDCVRRDYAKTGSTRCCLIALPTRNQ